MSNDQNNDSWEINIESLLENSASESVESIDAMGEEEEGKSLEDVRRDFMIKELDHKLNASKQENKEKRQSHRLRKEHLKFLSKITVYWLGLITVVSILQGFKGLGFVTFKVRTDILDKLPFYIEYSEFSLSDSVFIALVTTTTATILGLYTIAAIWLYKGKQEENSKKEDPSKADDK